MNFYIDNSDKVNKVLHEIRTIRNKKSLTSFDVQYISDLEQSIIDYEKVKKLKYEEEKRQEYNRKLVEDRMIRTGEDLLTALNIMYNTFKKQNEYT